jgi:hypothetical protein
VFHEAAFYSSEDELLNIAVPFLEASLETGAPSMVVLNERDSELIRSVIPDTSQLSFLRDPYLRPASVIKSVQQVLTGQMFDGTEQIRILGEVPHPGMGMPWEWWARYEATINHAFDQSPLWVLCLYDLRITSGDVLKPSHDRPTLIRWKLHHPLLTWWIRCPWPPARRYGKPARAPVCQSPMSRAW